MTLEPSSILSLYSALSLPILVLYLLVFNSFADRAPRYSSFRSIVSVRDAAVATLALDLAALSDFLQNVARAQGPGVVLLAILAVATVAHLVALRIAAPRFDEFSEALGKLDSSLFTTRLSSLYVSTLLLMTNGTTLVAVLELVRLSK